MSENSHFNGRESVETSEIQYSQNKLLEEFGKLPEAEPQVTQKVRNQHSISASSKQGMEYLLNTITEYLKNPTDEQSGTKAQEASVAFQILLELTTEKDPTIIANLLLLGNDSRFPKRDWWEGHAPFLTSAKIAIPQN